MRINLKLHELNKKHLEQYLVLRKYSILLYQHSQNSHIMCSFVSSWMLGFPTVLQPTEKSYTVSPLVKWLLFPPHPLWSAVIAKVLLTARLLWMPFSNTLSSSGLFVVKTTLHLLRLLFLHFPRVRRLWKKLKITSWKMWSLWCQNYQLLLSPGDEPGYTAKRKTNPPKWGKGRRIIMYPNQKLK